MNETMKKYLDDFEVAIELVSECKAKADALADKLTAEEVVELSKEIKPETLIMLDAFSLGKKVIEFPMKYFAAKALTAIKERITETIALHFMMQREHIKYCPMHGPQCKEGVPQEHFPELVDENLKPIG